MCSTKRAWKLNEFVAHAANVNCLALGHKSGRVLVTGGEDRKVNLWTVGKPNCIMSLTGHTTPIESVRFGVTEEMVVAGSMSGALKVWDLVEAKILRTLTGHKASIKCVDFHPFGDYVGSGSMDSNIKLWDIRRKGCIFTYKDHTNSVNSLRFSPDGKWVVSGGEDNMLKIWDLIAGKLLYNFNVHAGPINVIEFHPYELLLASGSSDRTVQFLDLESFQTVCSTDGDSTPVRSLQFHPDGACLYSGGKDLLKVYSWEPPKCHDSVLVNWSEVADMAVSSDQKQLIAATFSQTNVSCYVVDLHKVQPTGGIPNQEPFSNSLSSSRRSFSHRPSTQSSRQNSVPKEDARENQTGRNSPDEEENQSCAEIQDPKNYAEVFNPKKRLDRSPTRNVEPFKPPADDEPELPVKQPKQLPKVPPSKQLPQRPHTQSSHQSRPSEKPSQDNPKYSPRQATEHQSKQQTKHQPPENSVISHREKSPVKKVCAGDFLPKPEVAKNITENELFSSVTKGHDAMHSVLESRRKNLQIVRAMWSSGNVKTAVDSAIGMNDPAVVVDLLNVLNEKSSLYNLDLCTSLLPQIKDLVSSKYESYVQTSCNSVKIILKNLGHVIKGNMQSAPSIGVDISREERHRKCNACYIQLQGIQGVLDKRKELHSKLGNVYREIQILMDGLDH